LTRAQKPLSLLRLKKEKKNKSAKIDDGLKNDFYVSLPPQAISGVWNY